MSVPSSKRNESPMEFFHNAIKIRKVIKNEMLINFGLKVNAYEAAREVLKMNGLYQAYNSDYMTFEIASLRIDIKKTLRRMIAEITCANNTYVTTKEEYVERRLHWDRALNMCEVLLQLLQEITEELPVNANRLMPVVELIVKEKNLIKGVRKADNKILKNLLTKQ